MLGEEYQLSQSSSGSSSVGPDTLRDPCSNPTATPAATPAVTPTATPTATPAAETDKLEISVNGFGFLSVPLREDHKPQFEAMWRALSDEGKFVVNWPSDVQMRQVVSLLNSTMHHKEYQVNVVFTCLFLMSIFVSK